MVKFIDLTNEKNTEFIGVNFYIKYERNYFWKTQEYTGMKLTTKDIFKFI